MWHQFYSQSNILDLPVAAMIIFMVVFAAVAIRAWRRPAEHESLRELPLHDEDHKRLS